MTWERLGRVFAANGQRSWMTTHSAVPTPEHITGDLYRIYFSPRDTLGRSTISSLVIDLTDPTRVLELCDTPCLESGAPGAFDDRGTMVSWLVRHGGRRWMYYIGWNTGGATPWRTAIGLASCADGETRPVFERLTEGPILDRSLIDPYFVSNPCVLVEDGVWRMWYLSGLPWDQSPAGPTPRYHIVEARSTDGRQWTATGHVCVTHRHAGEVAISRPCVLKENGLYRMWFSYRGAAFPYRLGFAESLDGVTWERNDALYHLPRTRGEWDSDETSYPTVFDHAGHRYMLYCGNGYGKAGFGLAVLT